jgi:ribose transport system substrate-binding protein
MRDGLTGQKGLTALTGQGGWTEVPGCPVFINDDGVKGVQAMTDILAANPNLSAFGIMGGWPLFGAPQPYTDLVTPLKDKLASGGFVIAAADTIDPEPKLLKDGLVNILVGQRPFEMGYKAPDAMLDLIAGKKLDDNIFTGVDVCMKDNVDTCIAK